MICPRRQTAHRYGWIVFQLFRANGPWTAWTLCVLTYWNWYSWKDRMVSLWCKLYSSLASLLALNAKITQWCHTEKFLGHLVFAFPPKQLIHCTTHHKVRYVRLSVKEEGTVLIQRHTGCPKKAIQRKLKKCPKIKQTFF